VLAPLTLSNPKDLGNTARTGAQVPRGRRSLGRPPAAVPRYLPAYAPDLKLIEQAFAKLKANLRKAAPRTRARLWKQIGRLVSTFTEPECSNFFRHAGCAATWADTALASGLGFGPQSL